MLQLSKLSLRNKTIKILLCFSFIALNLNAQQLKITDFVMFGGQSTTATPGITTPAAPGFAVNIASSATITNGRIGSYHLIKSTGKPTLSCSLNSGGTISLGNSNVIYGNITAENKNNATGNILQMGANTYVKNNIDVNGNIYIKSGTVAARVTHPAGTTYSGPKPGGGEYKKTPSFPVLPEFPAVTGFLSKGTNDVKATRTIKPGNYRNMQLTGNQKVTFSGPGDYYFKSIHNKNSNTLEFDFKNTAAGNIRIYVERDVNLGKGVSKLKNGGAASRIYLEVHGNGSTNPVKSFSFTIASDSTVKPTWLGTVWAPYAAINIGSGKGSCYITGALWSITQVNIQSGSVIKFEPFNSIKTADSLIVPAYAPPANGKSTELIGPELSSLCQTFVSGSTPSLDIYRVSNDSVLIEVVAKVGYYDNAFSKLRDQYGMTDFVNNGPNSLIITGKIAINKLCLLNNDADFKNYINSMRPVLPPISSVGVANSGGDTAVHADAVRNAFHLTGAGIKVGVLSDGYNTIPGNPAGRDVLNEDLPGVDNTLHPTPVDVLLDYPYGRTTDEGRAMLQHIHDIAPDAALAFRTGFISEGDFAQGIAELQQAGCKIITDDITYLTSPFFKDGLAAQAVDKVKALGVSYFSAAGNFGTKSYESVFQPVPAPEGFAGEAHNFGDEVVDIFQDDSLQAGSYTIVMQWEDSIYSLGQGGALNDFDIYLVNDDGSILFGMNRPNLGADPIEILPFVVTANTRTNIMIVRAAGSTPDVRVKFIVYRGGLKFNEHAFGTSTLVGQANAQGAMAVAAARYTRTPAYGVSPAVPESFSSAGGTPVYGVVRNKPDFTAPDGGNTTVSFGSLDIEGDGIPNFFGTSAAAPHAAGVAALILQGKKRFYNKVLEPDSVRIVLSNTALSMTSDPGFDNISGYGLIQADSAVGSFAAPTPQLDSLIIPDSIVPGKVPFTVTAKGKYFKANTVVVVRGTPAVTQVLNSTTATAVIKPFKGNPAVRMYTPPVTPSRLDGSYSDSLHFLIPAKKFVVIMADNKTKKYGEALPVFTSTILVDGVPLDSSGLTSDQLELDHLAYTTSATSSSDVGLYYIRPSLKSLSSDDSAVLELYDYSFRDGVLFNNKMPLLITPRDTTITYGDKLSSFGYSYTYGDSLIPVAERSSFLSNIGTVHYQTIDTSVIALVDGKTIINGRTLTDADLQNMGVMASGKTIINGRTIINGKTIINGVAVNDTTRVVDLAVESIFNYQVDSSSSPLVSANPAVNGRTIINAKTIINGTAAVNGKTVINGSPILNSNTVGDTSNQNVVVIIDETDVPEEVNVLTDFKSVNMVTGITAGDFRIVPAAVVSENFEVRYGLGNLTILPASLLIAANDTSIYPGDPLPAFTATITGLKNEDTIVSGPAYTLDPAYSGGVGTYSIIPSNAVLACPECYTITYTPGTLYVNPGEETARHLLTSTGSPSSKPTATSATVSPNPTKGKFIISVSKGVISPKELYVSDMTGRTIIPKVSRISEKRIEIELPGGISRGVYLVSIKIDKEYKTFRVVKL